MSKRLRIIASLYLLWCIVIGTKHTWSMIKDTVKYVCQYIINAL